MPQIGMSYFSCPNCGCEEFTTYAQTVPADRSKRWTYEYTCAKCGEIMGLTLKGDDEDEPKEILTVQGTVSEEDLKSLSRALEELERMPPVIVTDDDTWRNSVANLLTMMYCLGTHVWGQNKEMERLLHKISGILEGKK